jgi:hypothetical protein
VLVTGVTKFSKVSIFSDLNQLTDISLSADYATICGITHNELDDALRPELDAMACMQSQTIDECIESLRDQYDGYCFHPDGPSKESMVYNPFSLLRALSEKRMGAWWFETGTPGFLVGRMRNAELAPERLLDGSIFVTERRLSEYQGDDPDPIPLLYQTGYLTISAFEKRYGRYSLAVPNKEVQWGLVESLLPAWAPGYAFDSATRLMSGWMEG